MSKIDLQSSDDFLNGISIEGNGTGTEYTHPDLPPPYCDLVSPEPPNYDNIGFSDSVKPAYQLQEVPPAYDYLPQQAGRSPKSMTDPNIDFQYTSTVRQAAGKKAKKAQKAADQAKWADNGDEDNKEGAAGEDNGGGEGGGGNGGDGGAGGDGGEGGGGDDDWNDWGASSKKKKGKKAKEEEKKKKEEEEERKRKEEEEEKKKQEEEEAANGTNALSWADETNGDDDWGGFTTASKKDKKGKKGKVCGTSLRYRLNH